MASLALIWDLIAVDKASGTFNRVAASADRAAASTGKAETGILGFSKKAVAALGALATVDIAAHIVKDAAEFQKQMTLIQTQAGASAQQVKQFSGEILNLSGKVAQAPNELSTSLYHVYSALNKVGATGPQMMNTVRIAAEGAKVGMASVEDTTNSLTATLASGIVRFNQAGKAMGALNAIVGAGDMHFQDLNDALGTGLLVTMKTFGVSLTDTGAALAVFGDNNIRGADAATKLRMAVQDLAKPGANAAAVLKQVHLTTDQLRNTLENNGLNAALHLLSTRMTEAGITGSKVGGFLEDAFTKKAGTGLAILTQRMNQFDEARKAVQKGAGGFGNAWQAVTRTASFAFDRIKAQFETAAITIGDKLLPAVTTAANWLGKNLPAIFRTLGGIVSNVASTVGAVLVPAWKAFVVVVRPILSLIGSVASFFSKANGAAGGLAVTVLALWAAFKGANLVLGVVARIPGVINRIGGAAEGAAASTRAMSGAQMALNGVLAGAAVGIGVFVMAWQESQRAEQHNLETIQAYTDAVKQDNEALGAHTRAMVADNLVKADAYKWATDLGIAQKTLTDAALGNRNAISQVNVALEAGAKAGGHLSAESDLLSVVMRGTAAQLKSAQGDARDYASAMGHAGQAHKMANPVIFQGGDAVRELGGALKVASAATKYHDTTVTNDMIATMNLKEQTNQLKDALAGVAARLNNAAAAVAWNQSLNDLTTTFKQNKGALDGHSAAALADKAALIGDFQTMVTHAQQMIKNGKTAEQVTGYIKAQYGELRNHATEAGADGRAVDALAKKLGAFPKSIERTIKIDTSSALNALAGVRVAIQNLPNGNYRLSSNGSSAQAGLATGGIVHGPGTGTSDTAGVYALSNGEAVIPAKAVGRFRGVVESLIKAGRGLASGGIMGYVTGAGFRGNAAQTAAAIAMAESGGNARAHNGVPPDNSYGLFQINMIGGLGPARRAQFHLASNDALYNPAVNARVAYALSGGGRNFSPWTTYTSGAYRQFLGDGGSVSNSGGAAGGGSGGGGTSRVGAANTALGAVTGAPSSPPISASGFNWSAFVKQIGHAASAVSAAGGGHGLTGRLEALARRGDAIEKRLQAHAVRAVRRTDLSGSAGAVMGRIRGEESGLTALGLSKGFINSLHDENKWIADAVHARNVAATNLAHANTALKNARATLNQDRSTYRSAIKGTFDITQAGVDPVTGKVSGGGILAQAKQAVTRAKLWVSGMAKLTRSHIFPPSYLRALFAQGPASLEQVQALLSMPKSEMRQLANAQDQLSQLAGVGAYIGTQHDQGVVNHAQRQVNKDRRILNNRVEKLGDKVDHLTNVIDKHFDRLKPIGEDALIAMVHRGERKAKRRA